MMTKNDDEGFIKTGEGLGGAIKPTPSGMGYMDHSWQTNVPLAKVSLV
jgi:hypothetical protein